MGYVLHQTRPRGIPKGWYLQNIKTGQIYTTVFFLMARLQCHCQQILHLNLLMNDFMVFYETQIHMFVGEKIYPNHYFEANPFSKKIVYTHQQLQYCHQIKCYGL